MRSMDERRASLQALKDGDVRILICTDVAALIRERKLERSLLSVLAGALIGTLTAAG